MLKLCVVAVSGLLLFSFVSAQPGSVYIPCLDTMAINARLVLVGTISGVHGLDGGHTNADVSVQKWLKGDGAENSVVVEVDFPVSAVSDWKARGNRLLIFGGLSRQEYVSADARNVIDMSDHDLKVLTANMKVLRDPQEVMQTAQNAIDRHPGVYAISEFRRRLPDAIAQTLGHVNYLNLVTSVPVDADLEHWAITSLNSTNPSERAEAAGALWHFPSNANATRLKRLLDDPAFSDNGPPDHDRIYFVRRSAYESLMHMGLRVTKPLLETESNLRTYKTPTAK